MYKACWQGVVIAESKKVERVEGETFFPPGSVRTELLKPGAQNIHGGWKGIGRQFHLVVNDHFLRNAASSFPAPKPSAYAFANFYAFSKEVEILQSSDQP